MNIPPPSPSEQPEDRDDLQALRDTLRIILPGRDIGSMTYGESQVIQGNAAIGDRERRYFDMWQEHAKECPDMTFDEFMQRVEGAMRQRWRKKLRQSPEQISEKIPEPSSPQIVENQQKNLWQMIKALLWKK